MDFELNSEERMIQKAVRDFVTKELPQGVVRELDEMGQFPAKQFTAQRLGNGQPQESQFRQGGQLL